VRWLYLILLIPGGTLAYIAIWILRRKPNHSLKKEDFSQGVGH
jgi:hypothetical protein